MRILGNFIGGPWLDATAFARLPVHHPSTGEIIAATPLSSAAQLDRAVPTARKAFLA